MLALLVPPVTCCALSPLHFSEMELLLSSTKAGLTQVSAGRGCNQKCVPMVQPAEVTRSSHPSQLLFRNSHSLRAAAGTRETSSMPLVSAGECRFTFGPGKLK